MSQTASFADLRLDWHAGFFPGVPSTNQSARFGPACLSQEERRTGARGFVNSSTVDHQCRSLIQPQCFRVLDWLMRMNTNRSGRLCLGIPPVPVGAGIDENHIFTAA